MDFIFQHDQMDCGPTCLAMVASHYGKKIDLQFLRDNSYITREGVSLLGISQAAEVVGFDCTAAKLSVENLMEMPLPCILHWNHTHFVVLYKISIPTKFSFFKDMKFHVADPGHGFIKLSQENFEKSWLPKGSNEGIALFLEPTEEFYEKNTPSKSRSFYTILNYLKLYKKQMIIMFFLLFVGSVLNLIFPFLTQNLIDRGIKNKDINLITIILVGQLFLFLGTMTVDIIRNWIALYVGTKVSINIISDFLKKLLQLPIRFFDTKIVGDITQRIQDNERIESFVSSQSILTFFSIITFSVFLIVLLYYDYKILFVYLVLTLLSVYWSYYWLSKRKIADYHKFQQLSINQSSIYEIISGVSEMKLNQFEEFKRKEWESIQHKLFNINIKILKINQYQISGFEFINQAKNIFVTFIAARLVVQGSITLGAMLSISYIIGQMNSPVNQLVNFFRSLQDAKLSFDRLEEIQNQEKEEKESDQLIENNEKEAKYFSGFQLKNVNFQYGGPKSVPVLKDINLEIPSGKITAIVGASGSGKTTLLKMLLKFYEPVNGDIFYNNFNLKNISPKNLREQCGVVMQDGYIFSDTIERNIITGDKNADEKRLKKSIFISNIEKFLDDLPSGLRTKIGSSGNGISGGQRQRILIARAVYRDPQIIFLDEATSALDAENEKIIHDNLLSFFKGKTVIIIAHRLSTVKNADKIVVLKNGEVVEEGNHSDLVENKNYYYNLIKNQLELGE